MKTYILTAAAALLAAMVARALFGAFGAEIDNVPPKNDNSRRL